MIQDRVRELRRVRASELLPNPRNWRKHPSAQQSALRAVLDEIGFAGALIARPLDDGRLQLIDGHLRAETMTGTAADVEVPVLVVDLTAEEADLLLAVHDPIGALAETDAELLGELTDSFEVRSTEISELLADLLKDAELPNLDATSSAAHAATDVDNDVDTAAPQLEESFQLLVDCGDEPEQRALFERLTAEGRKCRVLTL